MADLPIISLKSDSPTTVQRWQSLLAAANCDVITDVDQASGGTLIDIVITDQAPLPDADLHSEETSIDNGVVVIGSGRAGDVVFADEPTERELQLACKLLYEIIKLRRDRAASRQTQQRLTELAETDPLTGLANRRAWDAELTRRLSYATGTEATLCLALLDVDHFKAVNTKHGYTAADGVLKQVGEILNSSIRSGDFVARLGGDEFGILLANIAAESAECIVERIRASIHSSLVQSDDVAVSATAGLALRDASQDGASIVRTADLNLRRGKANGRNRTVASV